MAQVVMYFNPAAKGRPLLIPEAIAREEGWNLGEEARCFRNNNPGNLNFETWQEAFGAVLEPGPHARFGRYPSAAQGFAALVHLCGFPEYKGKSLQNLITAWAPPSDGNNTSAYLQNVEEWTGLTAETIIDNYLIPEES